MTDFGQPGPNQIVSAEGSIRITGRAGLDVVFQGRAHRVSSEMLDPPMTIALFPAETDAADPEERRLLLAFVTRGLEWAGFTVERIG